MPTIYILLTNTRTAFSRLIGWSTGETYTHVAIALDRELCKVYSFARRNPRFLLPAGLVREDVRAGVYARAMDRPSRLYALEISDAAYRRLMDRLVSMLVERRNYRYSILGVVACRFGIPLRRRKKFFCSQFVGEMLESSGQTNFVKPPALLRPNDFCAFEDLRLIYSGKLAGVTA